MAPQLCRPPADAVDVFRYSVQKKAMIPDDGRPGRAFSWKDMKGWFPRTGATPEVYNSGLTSELRRIWDVAADFTLKRHSVSNGYVLPAIQKGKKR